MTEAIELHFIQFAGALMFLDFITREFIRKSTPEIGNEHSPEK
jgi:hypothetical protein